MKPGLHTLTADAYHADPGDTPSLSSSIASILCTSSPAHARAAHPKLNPAFKREDEPKFDVGTVCHALILQGLEVAEIMDFPDWRTKAAKEARDLARAHGRIPMLGKQWEEVQAMVDAVATRLGELDVDPIPFTAGKPEQTLVWEEDGVLCRARLDWLHDDFSAIDDLKTTSRSASRDAWQKNLYSTGSDVQCAMYLRGCKAVTGWVPNWRWVIVETTPPYALSVISPGSDVIALADAKLDKALALWRDCLEKDEWPAYPSHLQYVELPPWIESQWLEREAREEMAA